MGNIASVTSNIGSRAVRIYLSGLNACATPAIEIVLDGGPVSGRGDSVRISILVGNGYRPS